MKKILFLAFALGSALLSQAQNPAFQWARSIGSSGGGNDQGNCVKTDASGNIIVGGFFTGTLDFDPTAGVFNVNSNTASKDIFVAKYSPSGALIWVNTFGSPSSTEECTSIAIDASNNIIISGYFQNTIDFDPGVGVATLSCSPAAANFYIAKYTTAGSFIWAKALNGAGGSSGVSGGTEPQLQLDNTGNIVYCGSFNGTSVDFDPSAATNILTVTNGVLFTSKYDSNGNMLFAKNFAPNTSGWNYIFDFTLDASNNIFITGSFMGTTDFDPSAGTTTITPVSSADTYVAKYDANGNYQWVFGFNGNYGKAIVCDNTGNIYVSGELTGFADFDPSAATVNLTATGNADFYIAKYTTAGTYLMAKNTGNIFGSSSNQVKDMRIDAANNLYLTGASCGGFDFDPSAGTATVTTGVANLNAFIAKYDANINYLWAKGFGGTNNNYGISIALDNASNTIITGLHTNTADFDPSAGTLNLTSGNGNTFFVGKYSAAAGVLATAFVPQETTGGDDTGAKIKKDALGNIYVTGTFNGVVDFDPSASVATLTASGTDAVFIAKYDANGNYIWAKGIGGLQIRDMYIDNTNNVFLTGGFVNTVDLDPSAATFTIAAYYQIGEVDAFMAKYDSNGNFIFGKSWGGIGAVVGADFGHTIITDNTGNIYLSGIYQSPVVDLDPSAATFTYANAGGFDMFISKFTSTGNFIWGKVATGSGNHIPKSVALDASNNFYLTGMFTNSGDFDPGAAFFGLTSVGFNDIFVAKYDLNGNFLNAFSVGGATEDSGNGICLDASGNFYITGQFWGTADFDPSASSASMSSSGPDAFIAKYTSAGAYVFAKKIASSNSDQGNDICLDAANNILITGIHTALCDFDPSAAVANVATGGGVNAFIAAYDNNGNYIFAFSYGDIGGAYGNSILSNGTAIYTTGYYKGTISCDPAAITNTISSVLSTHDILINKYNAPFLTGVAQLNAQNDFSILTYPNPTSAVLHIKTTLELESYQIVNVLGQTVKADKFTNTIDTKELPTGVYFLNLSENNGTLKTIKFVKE